MNYLKTPIHVITCSVAASLFLQSARAQEPPPNDMIANATVIDTLPARVTGSNVGATIELGELDFWGYPVGASVWWRWTATTNGLVYVDTLGSSFDTVLVSIFCRPIGESVYQP